MFVLSSNSYFSLNQEATRPGIPILLAVGAVHQHLIQNGLRMSASIVADTAQCFSTHHFACLIGYGARSFSFTKSQYFNRSFFFLSVCLEIYDFFFSFHFKLV